MSTIVKETCKLLDVKKTQTTSYHPSCNGQSERMMSSILASLSKYVDDTHDQWDRLIPFIQYSYNITPCLESTEYSPFFLVYGRYPRSFLELEVSPDPDIPKSAQSYIAELVEGVEIARRVAVQNISDNGMQWKKNQPRDNTPQSMQ